MLVFRGRIDRRVMDQESALYNSLLYTPSNGEAGKTQSKGTVYCTGHYLYATDGYSILRTAIAPNVTGVLFTGASVRDHLKNETTLVPLDSTKFPDTYEYFDNVVRTFEGHLDDLEDGWGVTPSEFLISPARLARLSRLRPTGEYPLDVVFARQALIFRYGPDTTGLIGLLDRKELKSTDLPEECFW